MNNEEPTIKIERRGGYRPNGGRPRTDTKPVMVRLRPSVAAEFRRRAKELHMSLGTLIEHLLTIDTKRY